MNIKIRKWILKLEKWILKLEKNKIKFKSKRINLVNEIVKTIFQMTNCAVGEIYFYRTTNCRWQKVSECHKQNFLFMKYLSDNVCTLNVTGMIKSVNI